MKPTRNNTFCPACGKTKMLFESESKAMNFIKFNSEEMLREGRKVPTRAYYCECCGGYHLTSARYHTESIADTRNVIEAYRADRERHLLMMKERNRGLRALNDICQQLAKAEKTGTAPYNIGALVALWDENKGLCKAKKLKKRIIMRFANFGIEVE